MLTLNRDGWLYWWAYLLADFPPGGSTDLCSLFWRVVLLTPLKLALAALAIVSVVAVLAACLFVLPGALFYEGHYIAGGFVVLLWSVSVLWLADLARGRDDYIGNAAALVGEYLANAKEPFCPIVRIK
jgi:hypothetical protein